jgi:hypothetical protein
MFPTRLAQRKARTNGQTIAQIVLVDPHRTPIAIGITLIGVGQRCGSPIAPDIDGETFVPPDEIRRHMRIQSYLLFGDVEAIDNYWSIRYSRQQTLG